MIINKDTPLWKIALIFLILTVVAFTGIAFLQYSLKWDMIDCYLPWRYFVAENLRFGVFPLWNPYQHLGYPIFADLRSVWYPEPWLIALTGGYCNYTLHFLFIAYLTIAGTGMYMLSSNFTLNKNARFLAGASWMLSGFVVGHGQEMFAIIATAFIPWVLYYYIRLLRWYALADALKTALFLFLVITGGYQALTIMLAYLIFLLFVSELAHQIRNKNFGPVRKMLITHLVLGAVVVASVSVLIVTFIQVSAFVGRMGGISIEDAWFMPFSPQSLLSLLVPFATIKDPAFWNTDLSMNNAYLGIILLAFFLVSLFRKKQRLLQVFFWFGLVCLLASMGRSTPVREWLFNYMPFLDLFRMPSYFSFYSIMAFILLGVVQFDRWFENTAKERGFLLASFGFIAVLLIIITLIAAFKTNWQEFPFFRAGITMHHKIALSDLASHFVVHGVIQLLIVAGAIWLILRKNKPAVFYAGWFTFIIIADLTIAARLNFFGTVASDQKPAAIHALLTKSPEGFPLPDLSVEVGRNRDQDPDYHPLWKNTNIFTKNISAEGFNSFRLDQFDHFFVEYPAVARQMLELPPLFISANLLPESQMDNYRQIKPPAKSIFVPDTVALSFCADGKNDISYVRLFRFDPTWIEASAEMKTNAMLVLQQQYFGGWSAFVNGKPAIIHRVNRLCMGILLPRGTHNIQFVYSNTLVKAGFAVSYLVFAFLVTSVVFFVIRTQFPSLRWLPWLSAKAAVLFFVFATIYFTTRQSYELHLADEYRKIAIKLENTIRKPASTKLVLNIDRPELFIYLISDVAKELSVSHLRFYDHRAIPKLAGLLKADTSRQLIYIRHNLHQRQEATELIRYYFPGMEVVYQSQHSEIIRFRRDGARRSLYSTLLDMESKQPNWSFGTAHRSAVYAVSGSYSWPLSATQPGSPGWVFEAGKVRIDGMVRIVADANVLHSTGADAALYVVVERNGENIWQRTVSSSKFKTACMEWTYTILVADPPIEIQPTDKLKVFFWINGTEKLWIDDFRISVFEVFY